MIGKIFTKSADSFKKRLDYIFGVSKHDHKINFIETIGGNFFCQDPLPEIKNGNKKSTDFIIAEFNIIEQIRNKSIDSNRKIKPVFHAILSLPNNETLTKKQWSQAVKSYMFDLGFSISNKFIAVLHQDTGHQHVHIVANRIRFEKDFRLVSDSNERSKSINAVSKIEDYFCLKKTVKPSDTWGVTLNQSDFKKWIICDELPFKQLLTLKIASAINLTVEDNGDVFMFVKILRKQNIYIHILKDKAGQPKGITFEYNGTFVSGSKLKHSRLTWNKITTQERIKYDPEKIDMLNKEIAKRDNWDKEKIISTYNHFN